MKAATSAAETAVLVMLAAGSVWAAAARAASVIARQGARAKSRRIGFMH
ncbi:MAG: hypothetical protein NTX51_11345 [Verrucomicrobia bacterium]|nr:hypothetical protein [Verrucomicrobiota bacterium]